VLFIVLSSAALVWALGALFGSLRAALGSSTALPAIAHGEVDRGALEDEKKALLRALKDLEYEHEVGKIDADDYARLERAYRARAKEVLEELDRDLLPYLSRAEELAGKVTRAAGAEEATAEKGEAKAEKKKAKKKKAKSEVEADAPSAAEKAEPREEKAERAEPEGDADVEPKADAEPKADEGPKAEPKADAEPPAQVSSRRCPKCETVNDGDAMFCKRCATPLAEATP
jgi:hypothetical protein